ncbi:MAG TPA: hypothetical protein VGS22_07775 [Thermoanaerobaculia bacterium]|jgi:hypothetical protein|nr:hypothetical protein [Thermoanaerobaculia bacterium]
MATKTRGHYVVLYLLLVAGCRSNEQEDPYLAHCTAILETSLRSPSTLKVTDVEHYKVNGHTVKTEYDAANAYDTPIRNEIRCEYPEDPYWSYKETGTEPPSPDLPLKASNLNAKRVIIGTEALSDLGVSISNSEAIMKLHQKERK